MTSSRILVLVAAGVAGGCSFALDFDGRKADAIDAGPGSTSGVDAAVAQVMDGGSSTSSGGNDAAPPVTGDSGTDAGTDCPGTAGPKPVRVGAYCIDSTEVTNADFATFRTAANKPAPPAGCEGSALDADAFQGPNQLPVVRLDWCSAFVYCQWAGKRLCGKIGGGASTDPKTDNQWFAACSTNGTKKYPYGATFQSNACAYGKKPIQAVATAPACVGGTPGIFDMSGNVAEWEDSCAVGGGGGGGGQVRCEVRGGKSDDEDPADATCEFSEAESRNKKDPHIGFRCCSP